jgi:hypothetical protein
VGPFITLTRHTLVDLGAPWDPQSIMRQYYADPEGPLELPAEAVSTLVSSGGALRVDAKRRWMGSLHADARVALLSQRQIDLDLKGTLSLSWWLHCVALPFRPRLRRFVEAKLDEVIEELKKEALVPPTTEEVPEHVPERVEALPEAPPRHFEVRFEVLSLEGRSLYQHTEGSL